MFFAENVNHDYTNSKMKTNNSTMNSSTAQHNYSTPNNHNQDEFQTGDFIISRQDVLLDWPAIWRVDSKTLLQKFEPFQNNNKTVYRSLSTVSNSSHLLCFRMVRICNIKQEQKWFWNILFKIYLVRTMDARKSPIICVG